MTVIKCCISSNVRLPCSAFDTPERVGSYTVIFIRSNVMLIKLKLLHISIAVSTTTFERFWSLNVAETCNNVTPNPNWINAQTELSLHILFFCKKKREIGVTIQRVCGYIITGICRIPSALSRQFPFHPSSTVRVSLLLYKQSPASDLGKIWFAWGQHAIKYTNDEWISVGIINYMYNFTFLFLCTSSSVKYIDNNRKHV